MSKRCSVDGCDRPFSGNGYCGMHNARMSRYGRLHLIRRENGTGNINAAGYVDTHINGRRQYEHIIVAETALGKPLPEGAVVHHANEIKSDNRPENLVVCPDEGYHRLIHSRMRAFAESGNPDWKRCWICKTWDDQKNLNAHKTNTQWWHKDCYKKYARARYVAQSSRAA